MITTRIMGGLGNQMFQWAFGRSLSLELSLPLCVDKDFYQYQNFRAFQLQDFKNLKYQQPDISFGGTVAIINDIFVYNKAIEQVKNAKGKHLYLNGYWQSEKYFKNYKKEICQDFSPSEEEIDLCKIIEPESVSIHIRRTDYVHQTDYHPVQDISYYKSAIDLIGDYNKLYVFSDEIEWCKNNLNFDRMIFLEGKTNIEDLRLMSSCQHNIIANSSFSWWGAFLNTNQNKIVVAPKNWFGPKINVSASEIIPEEWTKI